MSYEFSRNYGKAVFVLQGFIESVKRGDKSIIFGNKYVVVSRNVWDKLNKNGAEFNVVGVDEYVTDKKGV